MKIKAMVDGVEREVELTSEQLINAAHAIDKFYDDEDFDCFMKDWFLDNFDEEDWDMVANAKEEIVSNYRDNVDEGDWWKIMHNTIDDYILEHKQ